MATAGPTTKLADDFTVSAIGFGAGALSAYGDVDDAESLATLNRCLDLGVTLIDTADVYGGGSNERLLAKLLADRRDEVTLATKFGVTSNPADRAAGRRPVRGDAAYVRHWRRRPRPRWPGCGTAPRPSVWPRYRFPAPGGRRVSRRTLARCRSP
jgi:Aldo/keto reductase family